ncbi:MAG: patatin family protein [bacterium]|nr:patatin family protein [bacterium]
MKTGLVMEGGAMRGLFTAGVLDVFMENSLTCDGAIGVSAGACFGCNFKSKQIGRVIRYTKRFSNDPRFCSWRSLLFTGDLYNADFCYHVVPDQLDKFDYVAYDNDPMKFFIVCTDAETGEPVYKDCSSSSDELCQWVRSSSSMPYVSKPVSLDGRMLIDGSVVDSIPLRYFESLGYDRNVVILTQPDDYVKTSSWMIPVLNKIMLRRYPKAAQLMIERPKNYNEQVEYVRSQEKEGKILVIRPSEKLEINHSEHDPEIMQEVYDLGREVAYNHLNEVKKFWNKKLSDSEERPAVPEEQPALSEGQLAESEERPAASEVQSEQ